MTTLKKSLAFFERVLDREPTVLVIVGRRTREGLMIAHPRPNTCPVKRGIASI
jgi:hypothetical protein